jgi:hypothetical protein
LSNFEQVVYARWNAAISAAGQAASSPPLKNAGAGRLWVSREDDSIFQQSKLG